MCCEYDSRGRIHNTSFSLLTYKWDQYASVFVPGKPFQPSVMQQYSFLGQFASNEDLEEL
jgi:hypothetical protein